MSLESDLELDLARARVTTALLGGEARVVQLGRFELVRRLGEGATGSVYEARDPERAQRVAVKCLGRMDGRGLARFKREFRTVSELSHPNLVELHELFCVQDQWFFSMELVDGCQFEHFVRPSEELNVEKLCSALGQLTRAVMAIHAAGKLHCDLKPSNVLVTTAGRVVVLDFGLSAELAREDQPQSARSGLVGTPAYMAPEQAAGAPPSAASDWYAVGVMLFEALTGVLPFEGNPLAVLRQKQATDAPDPRSHFPDLPGSLCEMCRALLHRDPGARLSGEGVFHALGEQALEPTRHERRPAPLFVGREAELAALERAMDQVRAGKPRAILVGGRSGMGKSALLARFAQGIGRDALVLEGRCHQHESVPYKAFDAIVDAVARDLRKRTDAQQQAVLPRHVHALLRLFPTLSQVAAWPREAPAGRAPEDPREQRNLAFAAFKDLLARLSERRPLVLLVDDLQWGDADSARMLAHVLGRPDPPALLFVGAYRSEEVESSEFLGLALDQEHELFELKPERIELGPLGVDVSEELARLLLGEGASDLAASIAREAQGLPFFVTELVHHLRQRGAGDRSLTRTPTIEAVILDRVANLPAQAQRLLRVLSVAGGPIEHTVAARASSAGTTDFASLRALCAVHLARSQGGGPLDVVETYHDRVRETIAAALETGQIRELHAALAEAFPQAGISDPERLIAHYCGAGEGTRAREAAERAGQAAVQKLAFNRAAELFRKAIELWPADERGVGGLYGCLGEALAHAGRGVEAAESYLKASEGLEGREARRLRRMAVRQLLRSGQMVEGTRLAERLFREVGLVFPNTMTRTLLSYGYNRALLKLFGRQRVDRGHVPEDSTSERLATLEATFLEFGVVDLARGAALQAQFLRYASKARDPERLMLGLAWEAWNAAIAYEGSAHALHVLEAVERLAAQIATPYALASASSARAGSALFRGRVGEVVTPAAQAERTFRENCPGTHWEQNLVACYRYAGIEHVGGLRVLLEELPARARDAHERRDRFGTALSTLYWSLANLVLDRPEESAQLLEREHERLVLPYGSFHTWVLIRSIHRLLYIGDGAAALDLVESEVPRFRASNASRARFYTCTIRFLTARAHLAAAKHASTNAQKAHFLCAERDGNALLRAKLPMATALGEFVLGELAWRTRNDGLAREILGRCASDTERHQSPLFATYARRSLGVALGGDTGHAIVRQTDECLRQEGVRDPGKWTRVYINMERE